jgi:hypothetical protein
MVLKESKRLRRALPALIESGLQGRWIVFKDDAVHADFATKSEALRRAVALFGREGGFVVARVVISEPTPISAACRFA